MPEVGVSEEGVCCKIIFLRSLMIRSSKMFVRIGMKHSFFSNYLFAINFFVLLKLLLFAKN